MGKFLGREINIGIGKEKTTGTTDETEALKLHDADGGFTAAMVGALVTNTTDKTYTFVSAFVDDGELTVEDDIFITGEGYEIAYPRGTQVAPVYWIPRRAFDFDEKVTVIRDEQAYGVIEDGVGVRVVQRWAEGILQGVMRGKVIGLFLLNVFGKLSSTVQAGADDEAYKHVFTIHTDHQHPSMTLATETPEEELAYPLCMLRKLTILAELNEMVLFTAEMIAKKGETASPALTPAYVVDDDFACGDLSVKFAADTSGLAAATATKVRSVEMTIDNDIERDDVLGSNDPNDFLNKTVKVDIVVTKLYEDNTFRGYFTAGTGKAMRISIENTAKLLQTGGSLYPKLVVDLNKVNLVDWSVDKTLEGLLVETLTIKASFKIADSEMIEATLTNLQANY